MSTGAIAPQNSIVHGGRRESFIPIIDITKAANKPQISETNRKYSQRHISSEEGTFLCGGKLASPFGSTRVIPEMKKTAAKLTTCKSALQRHKQWLQQMHERKLKETREREQEQRAKEEKKVEFQERQARLRAKARGDVEEESSEDRQREEYIGANTDIDNKDQNLRRRIPLGEKRSRPVWSMTEGEAKSQEEYQEVKDEDDLLSFVENLQEFEQFCDDMELRILMSQVKERVHALEKEKHSEELKLQTIADSENAVARSDKYTSSVILGMEELDRGDSSNISNARSVSDDDNDLRSIADTIQSNSDATTGSIIHSRKSLNALVSRARDNYKLASSSTSSSDKTLRTVEEGSGCSSSSSAAGSVFLGGEMNLAQPVKFVVREDEGARLAATKSLNKLPFKCRNPAL